MMFTRTTIIGILGILILSICTGLSVNLISPRGIALVGQWDLNKGVVNSGSKVAPVDAGIEIGDIRVVKKIYDLHKTVFIDARSQEHFQAGHIKGAISMPLDLFDDLINTFFEDQPVSQNIITYCSGRECDDSHHLAQYLSELGYTRVKVFIDGYSAWEKKGYPIAKN